MAKYLYGYHEERGFADLYVTNRDGKTVWEAHYPSFYESNGEMLEETTIFEDGFMKDASDLEGLESYLKSISVINKGDELVDRDDYMDDDDDDDDEDDDDEYAAGGTIEAKIKKRLKNAFELPIQIAVYVPSTRDKDIIITKREMEARVEDVQRFLANSFGGFSAVKVEGGFESSDKGLIQEDAVRVVAFASNENEKGIPFEQSFESLMNQVKNWCSKWSQQSIGVEFENDLFYVDSETKFGKGGEVDLAPYKDIQKLNMLYKSGSKWYAWGSKYKHEATGEGYTKREALQDLDNHLSYATETDEFADGGEVEDEVYNAYVVWIDDNDEAFFDGGWWSIEDAEDRVSDIEWEEEGKPKYKVFAVEYDEDYFENKNWDITRMKSYRPYGYTKMAKGGMLEHGLKTGDKVIGGKIIGTTIRVRNEREGEDARVDLNTGVRTLLEYDKKLRRFVEKDKFSLGGMTAGRWYRDNSGEEFKFIGKVDSGANKGRFLFSDGQKSVYKELEDFEGGRPKETKLFGFFEDGGDLEEGVDLFEDYENIPANVLNILDKYEDTLMEGDYKDLAKLDKELNKIGYTFDFGLDAQAYDLRKIGQKGKSEYYAKGGSIKSLEKRVAEVNELIKRGNDLGIEVVDESTTWQAPMKYKPLKYTNGVLYVSYEQMDLYNYSKTYSRDWEKKSYKVGKYDNAYGFKGEAGSMQREVLTDIARMYRKPLKSYDTYGYFEDGGEVNKVNPEEMKAKIEDILNKSVPSFYKGVSIHKNIFDTGNNIRIFIAASDYKINGVSGQLPQIVSLSLDLSDMDLHPQVFGGNGGGRIDRKPNMNDPKEKYLAMKGVKVPFRTPQPNEKAVLDAIKRFADNYKKTLAENREVLLYQDVVDYDKLLADSQYADGGMVSEKEMRETYVKAFGKEYDDKSRKQHPLPLNLAYQVALQKLKKEGKMSDGGMMEFGGMLIHGFQVGDNVLEIYKGYGIVENNNNGVIEVLDPNRGTRFIIDLDDSKSSGRRKSMGMSKDEQIKSAKGYIDYLDKPLPDTLLEKFRAEGKMEKGGTVEDKINRLYSKSNFINDDFNWETKLLEMLQDGSSEAYNIYQSLTKNQKEDVLQQLFEMDNGFGMEGDGNIETSKENLEILLEDAKEGSQYADGGSIPNNYSFKTAKEVWEMWNFEQKNHFLLDHAEEIERAGFSPKGSWRSIAKNQSFNQLNDVVIKKLTEHISEGQYADGGETYFDKQASHKGGVDYYSVEIDDIDGEQIRGLEYKSLNAAKKVYDKYKKSMMWEGVLIDDIQLVVVYKNGDYDTLHDEYADGGAVDINKSVNDFVETLNSKYSDSYLFTVNFANKYAKISSQPVVKGELATGKATWGFIVLENDAAKGYVAGDLLKAAGANTPAKGARGSILNGTARYDKYSPQYGKGWRSEGGMAKGGEVMKHKHLEHVTIELLEPTSKGWKVKQIETHSIGGRKLSTPKEKVAYFSKEEIKDLFEPTMAMGGTFASGVKAIEKRLVGTKVNPKYQKDYGKTYDKAEAHEAASKIKGKMRAMELAAKYKKKKLADGGLVSEKPEYVNLQELEDKASRASYRAKNYYQWLDSTGQKYMDRWNKIVLRLRGWNQYSLVQDRVSKPEWIQYCKEKGFNENYNFGDLLA